MVLKPSGERVVYSLIPCFVLATLVVILRLAVRLRRHKILDASDYTIVAAWALFVAYTGVVLRMTYNPSGSVHIGDMNLETISVFLPRSYATQILAAFVATLAKVSLLLFWRSIFTARQFQRWNYLVMGVVIAWLVAVVLLASFRCKPIEGIWSLKAVLTGAKCIDTGIIIDAYEAGNIFTDLLIIVLPINELRKLKMRTSKKVGVGVVFALGGLVIVTSAVRLWYANNQKLSYFGIGYIIDASRIYLWSNIQNGASIICACMPMLVPLLRPLDKYFASFSSAGRSLVRNIRRTIVGDRSAASGSKKSPLMGRSPLLGRSQNSSGLEKEPKSDVTASSAENRNSGLMRSNSKRAIDRASAVLNDWSRFLQNWHRELPDEMTQSSRVENVTLPK